MSRSLFLFLNFDDYRSGNLVRSEYNQVQVPLTVLRLSVGRLPLNKIGLGGARPLIPTCLAGIRAGR